MIFITVGHQMPFDRMVKIVDNWAATNSTANIFAQIGNTNYVPENIDYTKNLTPSEFDAKMLDSEIIISHAGTGTIIKALEFKKPIFVMPRMATLGETRNDHQVHTVDLFEKRGYIQSFENENMLNSFLSHTDEYKGITISKFASDHLIRTISGFIDKQPR